jgi:hypothetical protein
MGTRQTANGTITGQAGADSGGQEKEAAGREDDRGQ